jgi:hypothetical protein
MATPKNGNQSGIDATRLGSESGSEILPSILSERLEEYMEEFFCLLPKQKKLLRTFCETVWLSGRNHGMQQGIKIMKENLPGFLS